MRYVLGRPAVRNLLAVCGAMLVLAAVGCSPEPTRLADDTEASAQADGEPTSGGPPGDHAPKDNAPNVNAGQHHEAKGANGAVRTAAAGAHQRNPRSDASPEQVRRELWDVSYINGQKVGHIHTVIKPVEDAEGELIEINQQGSLSVKRFDTPVTIGMTFRSRETPSGELRSFYSSLKLGPLPNISQGVVKDRSLETTTSSLGKKSTKTLAWKPEYGGFFAVEQSLRADPMEPGESRTFKSLMPQATDVAIADVTLEADGYEFTELLVGKRELLKIKVTMKAGGPHDTEQTMWADRNGEVLKSFTNDLGGMTTYRTSREVALRKSDAGSFDLGKFSTVPAGNIINPHRTKRIVYRVKLKHSDPRDVFSACGSQQVKAIDEHKADVTVIAIGPEEPRELSVQPTPPQEEHLAANNLIQSDDARVRALAQSVLSKETDHWKVAVALENAVYRRMTSKNFSTAFATAAEVARSLEGDCTEHAVLLAALCRARKIPARVAIGLVYYPPQRGFAFHMWNEIWTGERWVPLDATLGRGGIGAAHLKLTDSSLAGADSFSAFMPVARVMGQLEISVQEKE